MAYFNFKLAEEKYSLNPKDLITLQLIHQNSSSDEDNSDLIAACMTDNLLELLETDGYVTYLKNKKLNTFQAIRLTKKGKDLLNLIKTPIIDNNDVKMFEYLSSKYLASDDEERTIGSKKKTLMYCAIFRRHVGLTLYEMYWLCMKFLDEYKFTKVMQYIFFNDNKHRYGKFENHVDESPLYIYLEENRQEIEKMWAQKIKQ